MSRQRRERPGSRGPDLGDQDPADSADVDSGKAAVTGGRCLEQRLSELFAADRAAGTTASSHDDVGEPLVAYLHLRRGTTEHAKAVLEGHIRSFAQREGFDLRRMLTGTEGGSDLLTLRALVEHLEASGAARVLVVGPAREALVALHRMAGVQVMTLAQVRPAEGPQTRGRQR